LLDNIKTALCVEFLICSTGTFILVMKLGAELNDMVIFAHQSFEQLI